MVFVRSINMDTEIQKQIEAYELARSKYLKKITKDDLRNSRLLCEPQILRFDGMTSEERDHVITTEVMGWEPHTFEVPAFLSHVHYCRGSFKPSQDMNHALQVFEYTLIADKTRLIPCGSGAGLFWSIYYDDIYIGVGKTPQMAICKYALIINDVLLYKINAA